MVEVITNKSQHKKPVKAAMDIARTRFNKSWLVSNIVDQVYHTQTLE